MRATKKSNIALPVTTNTTIDTSTQAPIEIALQIDENWNDFIKKIYTLFWN